MIALFERAVGLYAHLININAYHQPGVEAGKKAANAILEIKQSIVQFLEKHPNEYFSSEDLAEQLTLSGKEEIIFKLLNRLSNNLQTQIQIKQGCNPKETRFAYKA